MPHKAKAFFVTGTDTGVGKTHVSVSLVKALVKHGLRVAVMKPIASGSARTPAGLRNDDAEALAKASNVYVPYATLNPYCFEPAVSPHIAAEEATIEVKVDVVKANFDTLRSKADVTVVEGAGGWYAPISQTQSMADLPKALKIPAVLVVGVRLGCLNHARLSKEAIEASGVEFAGWVANAIDPHLERAAENMSTLERLLGGPPLAVFPLAEVEQTLTGTETAVPSPEAQASPQKGPSTPTRPEPLAQLELHAHLQAQARVPPHAQPPGQIPPDAQAPAQPPSYPPQIPPNVPSGEQFARRLSLIS